MLNTCFPNIRNSYKPKWLNGKEVDLFIPEYKIAIEYDGGQWHKNVERDIQKTKLLSDHGISLIRIRDPKCPLLEDGSCSCGIHHSGLHYWGTGSDDQRLCPNEWCICGIGITNHT